MPSELIGWYHTHSWLSGCDLDVEHAQAGEEGRDLTRAEQDFTRLRAVEAPDRDEAWLEAAGKLVDRVQRLRRRRDYDYAEPSDLAGIRAARPERPALPAWRGDRAEWQRRLHGGLLGRIGGCMLGKPVEGWRRESIRVTAEETGNWPLGNYLRLPTPEEAARIAERQPHRQFKESPYLRRMMRGTMAGMVEDDDINYTTIGFAILKGWGREFTPLNVASFWLENLPILHTFTAERVAYRNLAGGVLPPASATVRNPYREWIGAQIRADYFGYANPGNPERAAEWAWRDASISHIRNGIYGEMWVAAMLAAAAVETDWLAIVRAGLAQIPARCRLREDVEKIVAAWQAGTGYEAAVAEIHAQWDETRSHHWCHTNSNAQIVALGLLYGEDDYGKTIARAVMPGFDTDCNGATCGSLWGVKHGVEALPAAWTGPLADTVETGVAGYHRCRIGELAHEMTEVAWSQKE